MLKVSFSIFSFFNVYNFNIFIYYFVIGVLAADWELPRV